MNLLQAGQVEVASADSRLVGDDHQAQTQVADRPQPGGRARQQLHLIRGGEILALHDDRAIAIQDHKAMRHTDIKSTKSEIRNPKQILNTKHNDQNARITAF